MASSRGGAGTDAGVGAAERAPRPPPAPADWVTEGAASSGPPASATGSCCSSSGTAGCRNCCGCCCCWACWAPAPVEREDEKCSSRSVGIGGADTRRLTGSGLPPAAAAWAAGWIAICDWALAGRPPAAGAAAAGRPTAGCMDCRRCCCCCWGCCCGTASCWACCWGSVASPPVSCMSLPDRGAPKAAAAAAARGEGPTAACATAAAAMFAGSGEKAGIV
jgi:hypothetical protein